MSIRNKKLPVATLELIDDICAQFERDWQSGQPPTIEQALPSDCNGVERSVLLSELLLLDVDYRRRFGEIPTAEEYVERFPEDATIVADAVSPPEKSRGAFEPPPIHQLEELFPKLEIIELLGAGGMGAVYKARQEGLDRVVALKILPEEFGEDIKSALRFTREARTLAKLNHPNVVSVYEFGQVAETFYFLMEYVDGPTLREVVAAGELEPKHALSIVPHLCDALQYAHDQGVVHRDIKPENILMATDGSVKIADFGLSRLLGDEHAPTALTGTHQVMGTPRYMAPEQLEGARGVDHRADIYSLGVVFYEMLTGELPIGRFAAPSQKVAIDVRLDDVVLRTLEKEPQRRYQRASQVKSDVQSITSTGQPELAATVDLEASSSAGRAATEPSVAEPSVAEPSIQEQELAGRLLLTRRQLMDRVRGSLRPLTRGQIIQIFIGILTILLGVQCWAPNTHLPHRLVSGLILHVYGLALIVAAANVIARIKRIDYSEPVHVVREKLGAVNRLYTRVGPIVGFPWWLMWIPAFVAVGFDAVLYPVSLVVSLIVGVVGLVASIWLYTRALKRHNAGRDREDGKLAGGSVAEAYRVLDEIERSNIR